jgi:acetyl esterase/lipase
MKTPFAKMLPLTAATIFLAGCEGGAYLLSASGPEEGTLPQTSLTALSLSGSDAGSSYFMSYPMPGLDGQSRMENAIVLLPSGDAPEDGWPVIAWAHPTTGVADACAPSATADLAGADGYLNGWLAAGYAVVAPDYEGLGTTGPHPYLHLASAGRSLNYAVEAAVGEFEAFSSRYAVVGHSQGGHAALGAAELAAENPAIDLEAVVAIAPVSQFDAQNQALEAVIADDTLSLAERVPAATQRLLFGSLILHGVSAIDESFDLEAAFGGSGAPLRNALNTDCLEDLSAILAGSVPGALLLGGDTDSLIDSAATSSAQVTTYLANNEPGRSPIAAAVLLQQGLADTTVFPSSTNALQATMTQINTAASQLLNYDDATHSSIVTQGFSDALNFVNAEFAAD